MWQKCPICNGEGKVTSSSYTTSSFFICSTCPTCNGSRIISELTGLPPNPTTSCTTSNPDVDFTNGSIASQQEYFNKK